MAKLGPEKTEQYKNWPELTILALADLASKNGFEEITMSSPHVVKQVWPYLGKKLMQHLYYDVPIKMGFNLARIRERFLYVDSAFGEQHQGESKALWFAKVSEIKKKFPEFFE